MLKKYSIANFNISVDINKNDDFFCKRLSAYESDFCSEPDISFSLRRTSRTIKTDYANLQRIGADKYYCKVDGADAIINYDPQKGKIIALTKFNHDYSHIDIVSFDVSCDYDWEPTHFNHNLVGNAMHYVAAMHSAFVFHSSAIACSDGGVLFSAQSGTGKSTHTALWLSEFDDAVILNDDTPIIRLTNDGSVELCGTPWAGTTGINANKIVPLKGIVFISRSATNTIEKIPSQEALKLFFEAIMPPLNARMHLAYLDTIKSMFINVPIYSLKCNMLADAAHVAREGIFGR
ncbi:MAG: hypothetical protein IKA95_03895 [Clostridia bacterium]|nr:hypothetical protein [Clostridia bacterium]